MFPKRNHGQLPWSSFADIGKSNKLQLVILLTIKRFPAAALLALVSALIAAPASSAQQDQTEGNRKIVNRVTPQYPSIARAMNLKGNVKAEAVVGPNGVVKFVEVKGGHPVLVQAAQNAIYKWKWAPAAHETREPIEVRFDPQ